MKRRLYFTAGSLFIHSLLSSSSLHAQVFRDKSQEARLIIAKNGNGVAAADYNNDGLIDLYFVSSSCYDQTNGQGANCLFKNNGDGTFTEVARSAGVQGVDAKSVNPVISENYGASWADFDNDGDVDLYLTNLGPDEFYENLGDGTFRNITEQAGLGKISRGGSSAAWFDYNLDGFSDLYVSAYLAYMQSPRVNILYRNNGDGTFTDVTASSGTGEEGWTFTTQIIDANLDGWPDLYCVNDFGDNKFYVNNTDGTFREATREYGLENTGHGMGVTLGDYDNDSFFDIYLTNIAEEGATEEWNPLFKHLSTGVYEDVSRFAKVDVAGWSWGTEFFDYDLDGYLDLYAVNGFMGAQAANYFYHNNGNGTFDDISQISGLGSEVEARGMIVADFNNDGNLDVVVANWRHTVSLYMNQNTAGNYLKVNLVGTKSNRDGWGAIVSVQAGVKFLHRMNDGIEFFGQSKIPLHFGLGEAKNVVGLTVHWPSGTVQKFSNIPANQTITIQEDHGVITSVNDGKPGTIPAHFTVYDIYPNPLSKRTALKFRVSISSEMKVEVYDILGRLVAVPIQDFYPAGEYSIPWNVQGKNGHQLQPGVYILRFTDGQFNHHKKIVVVK